MTLHELREPPTVTLASALAEFEARFAYPLGPGRSFRISHGEDYPRFFRAMGRATCFVAEREGRVTGALSVALRPIIEPAGSQRLAAYIGDLKVDPDMRGSLVFLRLAQAAQAWAGPVVSAAFGVVMDGTRASPTEYTGRVGIPSFLEMGKVMVFRIPTEIESNGGGVIVDAKKGEDCFRNLSRGRYASLGGSPSVRSVMEPLWLVHGDGSSCGRLEDTRLAKRLISSDGIEMQSAHLACFAWRTVEAAVQLIHAARFHAAKAGLPSLFVAIAQRDR
ncbi:MAG: N-acetyltransferase, partial [Tepidisphaeraceae bacterium]